MRGPGTEPGRLECFQCGTKNKELFDLRFHASLCRTCYDKNESARREALARKAAQDVGTVVEVEQNAMKSLLRKFQSQQDEIDALHQRLLRLESLVPGSEETMDCDRERA